MNGSKGSFCLHLSHESEALISNPRGIAWSSNVGHCISVTPQKVDVYGWDTKSSTLERFTTSSIERKLEAFNKYLESSAPSAENSVVTHAIRTFRSLRAAFPETEQEDGIQALKAFLLLLACGVERQPEVTFDIQNWALPEDAYAARAKISDDDWQALYQTLTQQLPRERLRLHLDLTLRHASGQLFQEAHYEAYRSTQMSFNFGLTPSPIMVKFESKAAGLHFTPPALARVIVEESLRILDKKANRLRIFDPACGSAEFLREALRQLLLQGFKGDIELIGWDISPAACDMARFVLRREVVDWNVIDRVKFTIQETDSLHEDKDWPDDVNLVVMNPPFVRWQNMTPEHKIATERLLAPRLNSVKAISGGNYDLSHVFFVQAAHCLADKGVLATIIPASVLDSKAAEKVRGHLSELLQAHMIARLGSHSLFSNALVDAAFYIGQNRKAVSSNTSLPIAFWSDYRSISSSSGFRALRRSYSQSFHSQINEETQEDKTGFCFYYQPRLGSDAAHWLPRPSKAWKLWHKLASLTKVGDIFNIDQGINTGMNKAFIITSEEWHKLPDQERSYFRPTVYESSLLRGQLKHTSFVFYPYEEKLIEDEGELIRKLGTYYELKLRKAKSRLLKRPNVKPHLWWELNAPRLARPKNFPKIVSTHFGNEGAYAWDEGGQFTVVQGHVWLPQKTVLTVSSDANSAADNEEEISLAGQEKIGLSYLVILNSPIFFQLVSAVSHHVSGGQWDLSKRFVIQVPLPNLFDVNVNPGLIEELSEVGGVIHKEGLPSDGLQAESLDAVARAYGLTFDDI